MHRRRDAWASTMESGLSCGEASHPLAERARVDSSIPAHELPAGLYELLVTRRIAPAVQALGQRGRTGVVDEPEAAALLSEHVGRVLQRALRAPGFGDNLERQLQLCNLLLNAIGGADTHLAGFRQDTLDAANLLLAVLAPGEGRLADAQAPRRPNTPLSQDALFVHAPREPALAAELRRELESADRVDLLCAFVVWSGVRVLMDELRRLRQRGVPIRIITTTYTGTTDPRALDELTALGVQVRVSYDTRATRLHAKAWLFQRDSGFSTAYVGSSNLTHSAIHDGLEWNVRLSEISSPGLLERFRATFDTYWADPHFEPYEPERFAKAVQSERAPSRDWVLALFDIHPYPFQLEILERLEVERQRHGHWRNLVVAATGTGKTVIAAFDYRRLAQQWGGASLLFVAHRREILEQSLAIFRTVLRDGAFGELFVGGQRPRAGEHVFASVQSLSHVDLDSLAPGAYDVVIVDEFHHSEAPTYRRLLEHLKPKSLLGLTATPERVDGQDVTHWFDGRIAAELRLWNALDQGLLCPFQYFGISDDVDLSQVTWKKGSYDAEGLSGLYTGNEARLAKVLRALGEIVQDPLGMRALGFCVSVKHAEYMAARFSAAGIPAVAITGNSDEHKRSQALGALRNGTLKVIFSVDVFNEGLDLPEVDTVLLLRPTESVTVFLQQIGRGLRLAPGKPGLTVLDFIGQQRREFRFGPRFIAMSGIDRADLLRQVEQGFPYLPAGCSIQLDRVAQDAVLDNIRAAVRGGARELVAELRGYGDVPLAEYLRRSGRALDDLYRETVGGWTSLRRQAGFPVAEGPDQRKLEGAIGRLRHLDDRERVELYTQILAQSAPPDLGLLTERQRRLLTMLRLSGRPSMV